MGRGSDWLEGMIGKAGVLLEALPYIQQFRGQTFLIKVGGSAMEDPELVRALMRDIVFLEAVGINPVIVHGGGKAISAAMAERGLSPRFVSGLRATDGAAVEVVRETLDEVINPGLVRDLEASGGIAVGVSGLSVFTGRKVAGTDPETGVAVDIGFVGEVVGMSVDAVREAVQEERVPVVSPLAAEQVTGQPLNVNADVAAAALAGELGVNKLIFLSDVLGVMRDPGDPTSLFSTLRAETIASLKQEGIIGGGMIPKVDSSLAALRRGVGKVHLIDGRIQHSLVLEVFTDLGIGTQITLE